MLNHKIQSITFKRLRNKINFFTSIINDFRIICLSYFYKYKAIFRGLIGVKFDTFGRNLGWNLLLEGDYLIGKSLIINPINIVRYFEFQFVHESNEWNQVHKILDVSSPRMFALYIAKNYPHINYHYINPDVKDTEQTKKMLVRKEYFNNLLLSNEDATKLNYMDGTFDTIISISVIEHIPDNGDIKALKEMWRVLRPNGSLIITIPCMPKYFEEYLDIDEYQLYPPNNEGKYFGSRYYDSQTIKDRIFKSIGKSPDKTTIFGEINQGTFFNYREREWTQGILESIKDPYYIATEYKLFNSLDDITGLTVVGLAFKKN